MKARKDLKNIFVDANLSQNASVFLDKEISQRLKKVMRFKKGWLFALFNGRDGLFLAEVIDSEVSQVKLLEKLRPQPNKTNATLLLPILKKEALSNAIRQSCEMGIDNIQPIITQYTVEKDFKQERYLQIILNAAEQSERLSLPNLLPLKTLQQAVQDYSENIFWACERIPENVTEFTDFKVDDAVLIGPEGGFSEEEKAWLFNQQNIKPQTLGKNILKADTAVVVALAKKQMLT